MSSLSSLSRTLDQELTAILRGASLECFLCGEFLLHRPAAIACPECGLLLAHEAIETESALESLVQAG